MTKKFTELREKMSLERQERVRERTQEMLQAMPLQELRQARKLSQEAIATVLGAKQASISKLEHRTDMYVSTLRSYIEAMGGTLEIVAQFPDGKVRITQFTDI
jgi:DNA-binding XRE family transcriptional regulator